MEYIIKNSLCVPFPCTRKESEIFIHISPLHWLCCPEKKTYKSIWMWIKELKNKTTVLYSFIV